MHTQPNPDKSDREIFIELFEGLTKATTVVEVNVAAGKALAELGVAGYE
jgi:hypothetical protein